MPISEIISMIIVLSFLVVAWIVIIIGLIFSAIRKDAKQVGAAYAIYTLLKRKMK